MVEPTGIDESTGRVTAQLFAAERQCNITWARVASRRHLYFDGMWAHELAPHDQRAENHLQALEKVVANDDDRCAAVRPCLARTNGLYLGRRDVQRRVALG